MSSFCWSFPKENPNPHMQNKRKKVYDKINRHPTSGLCPSLDEAALIQALVSQYLAHGGYIDTSRAFSDDVQKARASDSGRSSALKVLEVKEDKDTIYRQRYSTFQPFFFSLQISACSCRNPGRDSRG